MFKKIVLIVFMLSVASVALAKGKGTSPAEEQAKMQQAMQMMTPMFGQMVKSMMEAELGVLAEPETASKLAAFTKNYYNALIKEGFSKEDALKIAIAAGFPRLPGMQR